MKKFYVTALLVVILYSAAFSQSKIVSNKFHSASLDRDISLKIYKPANYSETGDPYRVYVFLHGACGSIDWDYASEMKSSLDSLIENGTIDPILVVFPVVRFNTIDDKAIACDAHWFINSARNGKYEDVISIDLLEWLGSLYNVTTQREGRAVGGFSMGALGAVHMAIYNSDKFIACISHDGSPSIQSLLQIEGPGLRSETPGPPYKYDINNGIYSLFWFSEAAAFSPNLNNPNMPEWKFDFPFDDQGNIIDSVFTDQWMAKHDPATLLVNADVYKNKIAIYFDASDVGKPYADILAQELTNIGHPYTYKTINQPYHGTYVEMYVSGLLFLDEVMDAAITKVGQKNNQIIRSSQLFDNYPNPFNSSTILSYQLPQAGYVNLSIYNSIGQHVITLADERQESGTHTLVWDGRDPSGVAVASGVYVYLLKAGNLVQQKKMILLK